MDAMFDAGSALKLPVSIREGNVSFSGVETKVQRMISSGEHPPGVIASSVFRCVGETIAAMICYASEKSRADTVLMAGGVSSSENIRGIIAGRLGEGIRLYSALPGMGSDNACGVAVAAALLQGEEL